DLGEGDPHRRGILAERRARRNGGIIGQPEPWRPLPGPKDGMFKPTTFGKFFLYEKLAIGGMAEIFKAKLYGIAGFEKTLVVKQILPEYASDVEFVNMFIDEANIAVSLTHGNIVPIYELGKIGDRYYIAMEYVDG